MKIKAVAKNTKCFQNSMFWPKFEIDKIFFKFYLLLAGGAFETKPTGSSRTAN